MFNTGINYWIITPIYHYLPACEFSCKVAHKEIPSPDSSAPERLLNEKNLPINLYVHLPYVCSLPVKAFLV